MAIEHEADSTPWVDGAVLDMISGSAKDLQRDTSNAGTVNWGTGFLDLNDTTFTNDAGNW